MAASTYPAAAENLVALLAASDELEGVQVEWGWPTKALAPDAVIVLGAEAEEEQANQRASRPDREERYLIEVVVRVSRKGDAARATSERAVEILDELREQLREDPTVGGAVIRAQVERWKLEPNVTSDNAGRIAYLEVGVGCRARI